MAENKKFSVRTDGTGQNVFVSDVFLLSVPEEDRVKALSIDDDGRVVLTTVSGGSGVVTSYTNATNNRVITSTGAGGINGESNLTFDGSTLTVTGNVIATSFTGSYSGSITSATTASKIVIDPVTSTDTTAYPVLVGDNSVGAQTAFIDNANLSYNASSNTLTATTFNGALSGNATTATTLATARAINGVDFDGSAPITVPAAGSTLTDTVTVAKGGTNATSFADKAVIITQDSGIDTLSAAVMSTNGQLLIGGTDGPTVAVPTGGDGLTVTVGNGTLEYDLDDALTTVTSLLNTSLVVGRDATDQIKFSTNNQIIFRVDGNDGVIFKGSGEIEATKFDGDLEGNADTATSSSYAATASLLIGTVNSASYAETASLLIGTVDSASYALTSDSASKITIDPVTSTDTTAYPVLVGDNSVGAQSPFIDNTNLSYNASTNTLTTTTFSGALSGNASTATTASYANELNPSAWYKEVGTTITSNKDTTNTPPGFLYPMNSNTGTITFTLNAGGASLSGGEEWDFFVLDLTNQIDFTATGGESIISENGLKANSTGSAITAKFLGNIGGTNTWALVGSLQP